jgi:hypothetical protein
MSGGLPPEQPTDQPVAEAPEAPPPPPPEPPAVEPAPPPAPDAPPPPEPPSDAPPEKVPALSVSLPCQSLSEAMATPAWRYGIKLTSMLEPFSRCWRSQYR